ncbi:MAG: pseudouridine synthase [Myxococcota bacterium]|jgi:23S rRNA pseudouridine2604 synthase
MRINRFFTDNGVMSRRAADRAVEEGRVTINDRVAVLGDQVEPGDRVTLDGQPVGEAPKKTIIIAYNKPVGIECTSDERVKDNIITAVNYPERVFHIGRLDKFSDGLILLTNMGDIVNKILRARFYHEKEYIVETNGPLNAGIINALASGVELDDGPTRPCVVERLASRRLRMVLTEGRNRQIRRMIEHVGLRVSRLRRIRIMNIHLGKLPVGKWRNLDAKETAQLMSLLS